LSVIIETSQDYIDFKNQFSKLFDDENSEVRKELNKLGSKVEIYLQKQFPDGTKVRFGVNPPNFGELLKALIQLLMMELKQRQKIKGTECKER